MRTQTLLVLLLSLVAAPTLACEYYAYVDYGPATKEGQEGKTRQTEPVYHSSGVMSLEHGFKAVYSDMGETRRADGFQINNLGPFENEAVAGKALSDFIDELEARGYVENMLRHEMPAVIERDKVVCE